MKKHILVLCIILLMASSAVQADVHTATTCNYSDVLSKYNDAADGDNVAMPPGTCNWGSNTLTISKEITLVGGGQTATILSGSSSNGLIVFSGTKPFRLTNFSITASGFGSWGPVRQTNKFQMGWRIDHVTFNSVIKRGIVATGAGLIDHVTMNSPGGAQGVSFFGNRATGGGDTRIGSWEWQYPPNFGTDNATYLEDSTFNWGSASDSFYDAYGGARFVVRHNTIIGIGGGHHGNDSGGYRSPHSYEIYNNTFYQGKGTGPWVFNNRGGSGFYFNNAAPASGYSNTFLYLAYYRDIPGSSADAELGECDGSNSRDGNDDSTGWICQDQQGATSEMGGHQITNPIYEWNNTIGGTLKSIKVDAYSSVEHIQQNRDYYDGTASFAGTSGVGYGAVTSRPTTCTPKVGYYATDEHKFYQCTATNTWTYTYAPYTYPHPLAGVESEVHVTPPSR